MNGAQQGKWEQSKRLESKTGRVHHERCPGQALLFVELKKKATGTECPGAALRRLDIFRVT